MAHREGSGSPMTTSAELLLRELLPAGEWSNITVIKNPQGMMGSHEWALLARARWIRERRDAFLKLILVAPPGAGLETNLVTGRERLDAMWRRLEDFRADGMLPVVEIIATYRDDRGLLIAMEAVHTLHDLLETQLLTRMEVAQLLRQLAPSDRWVHFDVCPRNVGRNERGRYVLIDLDSVYVSHSRGFDITLAAYKQQRLARAIDLRVQLELGNGRVLSAMTGRAKYVYELLLAALEALVGSAELFPLMLALSQEHGVSDAANVLVDAHRSARPLVAALIGVATGEAVDVPALADKLEAGSEVDPGWNEDTAVVGGQPKAFARHVVERMDETPTARHGPGSAPATNSNDFSRKMRADKLTRDELIAYADRLEQAVAAAPEDETIWMELQYLHIGYLRDMAKALEVTRRFLARHPQHQEAQRWERILRLQMAPSEKP
jgi:hypothetical protein